MAPPPPFCKAEPEWSIECLINDSMLTPRHLLFRAAFFARTIDNVVPLSVSTTILPHRL